MKHELLAFLRSLHVKIVCRQASKNLDVMVLYSSIVHVYYVSKGPDPHLGKRRTMSHTAILIWVHLQIIA